MGPLLAVSAVIIALAEGGFAAAEAEALPRRLPPGRRRPPPRCRSPAPSRVLGLPVLRNRHCLRRRSYFPL